MGCSTHDSSQVPSDKSIPRRRVESPRCERSPCRNEPRCLHDKQRHMRRDMCCMRIPNRPTIDGRASLGPTNARTTHSANWNADHAKQLRSRTTQDSHERVRTRASAYALWLSSISSGGAHCRNSIRQEPAPATWRRCNTLPRSRPPCLCTESHRRATRVTAERLGRALEN